jgi:hypothetical protein
MILVEDAESLVVTKVHKVVTCDHKLGEARLGTARWHDSIHDWVLVVEILHR